MPRPLAILLRSALLLACGLAASAPALAGRLAEVEIIDRVTGETLPQYRHQGRLYVAGEPGHAYEIAVRNRRGERLLAVMSVDGVNVLSGETAATAQGGYVFDAWERDTVRGWRKTLDEVAQFHFTEIFDSYAARTGRPNDVGVIGVALFREVRRWREPEYSPYDGEGYRDKSSQPQAQSREESSAGADAGAPGYEAKRRSAPAPSLGTGLGRREYSRVDSTSFERASATPEEVITIVYDSRENLVAKGVLRGPREYARRRPQPFPGGFVPDP